MSLVEKKEVLQSLQQLQEFLDAYGSSISKNKLAESIKAINNLDVVNHKAVNYISIRKGANKMSTSRRTTIKINNIKDVYEFVELAGKQPFYIDVYSADRRYCIDAKSIMGMFALDLSKPVIVEVSDSGQEVDNFFKEIARFA